MKYAKDDKKLEKKRYFEKFFSISIRILGIIVKKEADTFYIKINFSIQHHKNLTLSFLNKQNILSKSSLFSQSNEFKANSDRSNEIIIHNIPINQTEENIKRQFLLYENITKVIFKPTRAWKTAYIFFANSEEITKNFTNT